MIVLHSVNLSMYEIKGGYQSQVDKMNCMKTYTYSIKYRHVPGTRFTFAKKDPTNTLKFSSELKVYLKSRLNILV